MEAHKIIVKAFRAVDEPACCLEYLRGHLAVLEMFKIAHITSNTIEWTKNKDVIAFTIESLEDGSMLGGGRLQLFNYKEPLPVEQAVGSMDPKIYEKVNEWAQGGVAEFCGLWNTREAVRMGISSIFLARIGVAIATQLKVKHLLALTAPTTVKTSRRVGFVIERSLGNEGTFFYPKINLLATVFRMQDPELLEHADEEDQRIISGMREQLDFEKTERLISGPCEVAYHLKIKNLDLSHFYHLNS